MLRKFITVFLSVLVFLIMPAKAFALNFDADRKASISVNLLEQDATTPIVGVELSLYRVATVGRTSDLELVYAYTDEFRGCGVELDDPELSKKLDAFVSDNAAPLGKLSTDGQGQAVFTNLPLGLYFIKQTNAVEGYAPCTPFLVTVPTQSEDGYIYDINASPKTDIEKLCSITIKKTWNTDSYAKIPDSVTVELLYNNTVVETATLYAGNNWQLTYTDMPESDAYSIKEVNVPAGFTATYSKNGYVFTVTNTSSLAQTGQLIWPIPVLAMAGLFLIGLGSIVLRKAGKKNA